MGRPGIDPAGTPSPTAGLRTATIVLFWCCVGSSLLFALAATYRRSVWVDFRDGRATFADLDDADGVVGLAVLVAFGLTIASIIVLSIWALRTARHARLTGAADLSPGLACGGWYIPLANAIVPFVQLRRVAVHRRRSTAAVNLWQGLVIAAGLFSFASRAAGQVDVDDSRDDVISKLTTESVLAFVSTVVLAAVTVVAVRAMRDVDGLTAPRP